jgi:hypothetical protein
VHGIGRSAKPPKSTDIERKLMIVLAKGSITKPEALAPYVDDEMRVVGELNGEGTRSMRSSAETLTLVPFLSGECVSAALTVREYRVATR